ncbi:hypothetical protein ACFCVY_20410 [Streptomyces sp. NPDC056411]|uniref:hypothetical protein n=1 Tax=Streptomyces sp. NPDC056411 TaxID=3345813 RepID=UPI0035D99038
MTAPEGGGVPALETVVEARGAVAAGSAVTGSALTGSAVTGPAVAGSGAAGESRTARPVRRGPADPVRALMHRHQMLCAHAVDALEIAAGLEAHGVTDRTAARFRHRDVFSLAEELYARVPRAGQDGGPAGAGPGAAHPVWGAGAAAAGPADTPGGGRPAGSAGALGPAPGAAPEHAERAVPGGPAAGMPAPGLPPGHAAPAPSGSQGWGGPCTAALQLLPGAVAVAAVAAPAALGDAVTPVFHTGVGALGAVLVALAVRLAVRSGPLRARHSAPGPRTAALWVCWTAGYAVLGDWLLGELQAGGPDLPYAVPRAAVATAVALPCAVLPAAGCARWFALRGRRALAASRGLEEFAARVRPLLLAATALFLAAQTVLLLGARVVLGGDGAVAAVAVAALGTLLFLARLLVVHGFPGAAATGLACAAALEALAPALVLTARLPGLGPLSTPVDVLTSAAGPAAVPALACTAAALGLLGYGLRALTGASAHAAVPTGPPRPHRP